MTSNRLTELAEDLDALDEFLDDSANKRYSRTIDVALNDLENAINAVLDAQKEAETEDTEDEDEDDSDE